MGRDRHLNGYHSSNHCAPYVLVLNAHHRSRNCFLSFFLSSIILFPLFFTFVNYLRRSTIRNFYVLLDYVIINKCQTKNSHLWWYVYYTLRSMLSLLFVHSLAYPPSINVSEIHQLLHLPTDLFTHSSIRLSILQNFAILQPNDEHQLFRLDKTNFCYLNKIFSTEK